MALRRSTIPIAFRGGINRKSDEKTVPATQLLVLENGVFTKGTSIAKRYGYEALSPAIDGSTDEVTGLIRLAARDEERLGFTLDHCYSRQTDADQWSDVGDVFSVISTDKPAVRTGTEQTSPDHATNDGVSIYAWEDSRGGVWYSVADATSGRLHIAAVQADADGLSPRCVACGPLLHIYYANAVQGRVYVVVVNPASPVAAVTPAILVDDLNTTNPVYDVCATSRTGSPCAIVWHERATTNMRVGYVDPSGALGSPLTGHPPVYTDAVALATNSPLAIAVGAASGLVGETLLYIAFTTSANGCVRFLSGGNDGGLFAIAAETANTVVAYAGYLSVQRVALGVEDADAGDAWVAFEEAAVEPSNRFCVVNTVTGLTTAGVAQTIRSVGLASRAWTRGEDVFAYFVHDTTYFNVYLALRFSDFLCIARTLPGLAADGPARRHQPSAHVDGDVVSVALPYNERLPSANADSFTETGVRLVALDYESEDSHQYAQLGRGLYLAGACAQHYDGRTWTEQGFHVGPEVIATAAGSSGSLTASSTYLYRAYYEWTDAQGEIHRGPVSFGTLITLAPGEDEVTLTLPTLRLTAKTNVRIVVARSRAAETGKTAELFLVTSRDPSASGANGYVANDPTTDTVTFNDRMSDANLEDEEPLYTNGGILSNDAPALGAVIARSKRRLFTTDPSDPYTIRFSQELEDGYGVEFAPELVVKVDPAGGPVSALLDMDGEMVVYQANAIRTFGGLGPTASGDTSSSGFSEPRRLTTAVGCTDPASVVETPEGHIFRSDKGLWQLDRSGQVLYIGAPAEAFNAQRVTAAVVLPARTGIVFLTDDGSTVHYDYLFQQWSTFTNHLGHDAVVVGGVYHYLRTDGRVFRETVGSYSDAGQRITLRLETAWIRLSETLQGLQRFYYLHLIGTWISPHQLVVTHRSNYRAAYASPMYLDATGEASSTGWITGEGADTIGEDPITGTVYGEGNYGDGVYGGDSADVYQWHYHIGERGQSVQFRFEDFERAGLAGASFELTEMLIEAGHAGPAYKPMTGARSA